MPAHRTAPFLAYQDPLPGRDTVGEAAAALKFWEALEYLAPQAPPAARADDGVWELPSRSDDEFPWHDPRKQAVLAKQYGRNWRCHLYAGIIEGRCLVETARALLNAAPLDLSERQPPAPAACVVIGTDAKGLVAWPVFVSSVPWALARLRDGAGSTEALEFGGFFGLGGAEEQMRNALLNLMVERRLMAPPPPGDPDDARPPVPIPLRPITMEDMEAMVGLVFRKCDWVPDKQEPWRVKGRRAPDKEEDQQILDDPLNSFIAEDLERVGRALAQGDIGSGLQSYLRGEDSTGRIDLEQRRDALLAGVAPERLPPACWPAPHPLVTAQQFAVNMALRELADSAGIFSVNGPPGTGKTTMLKDIVAAVVVRRADVLASIASPVDAFATRLEIDNYQYKAFQIDPRLAGFGIVVSSANNGAVENITKDLPALSTLAKDIGIDFFPEVAESIAAGPKATQLPPERQRWGLVAAVLGSKTRRQEFAQRFWFAGLPRPLKPGEPSPPPPDPRRLRSLQDLFRTDESRALPWDEARDRYRAARDRVDTEVAATAAAVAAVRTRREARDALGSANTALPAADGDVSAGHLRIQELIQQQARCEEQTGHAHRRLALAHARDEARRLADAAAQDVAALAQGFPDDAAASAKAALALADRALQDVRDEHEFHQRHRPGFFSQFFRTEHSRRWNARDAQFGLERTQGIARRDAAAAALATTLRHARSMAVAREKAAELAGRLAASEAAARRGGAEDTDCADVLAQALDTLASNAVRLRAERAAAEQVLANAKSRRQSLLAAIDDATHRIAHATAVLDERGLDDASLREWDLAMLDRASLHRAAPYSTPALFAARSALFVAAMDLHKAFIAKAWDGLRPTLAAFVNVLMGKLHPGDVRGGVQQLWDAFFLVVPVVSTTFASFPRLFSGMHREALAWLLIDEAGQATPQLAAGAIWRSRRTVLVGDPLQLEPVVGVPEELIAPLLERCAAERQWAPPAASAQTLADKANRYGVLLAQGDNDPVWLGAPLVVHRRCLDPMFGISNSIAYDNKMVFDAGVDSGDAKAGPSRWIDMPATDAQGHWAASQARMAAQLVREITGGSLRDARGKFRVYVITPFRTIEEKMVALLHEEYGGKSAGMVGTVHKFQGKEAEHVVFLLGGDPRRPGVIAKYAGAKPNLVNVAVTRARRRLYVIGDLRYWTGPADVQRLYTRLAAGLSGHVPVEAGAHDA